MSSPRVIRHHHKHNLRHRYEIIKTLGQGTYGKVKLAIEKATGLEVAIKSIRKSKIDNEQDLVRIRREIENMSSLCHPHIIGIYEVFENKEKIIIIMEYASGGEVYDYINTRKVLKEEEARKFFRQIVSAINHCHQNGIVHRDLKLENIILDHAGNIKIADFGLSNIYSSNSLLQTFCGSPLYASPEIVNGLPYYGPEVDAWSIGVLLYTLVYGAMPFDGSKGFCKLRRQITAGDYYEPPCPSEASGLIRALLTVNPAKRATLKDVSKHWWTNLGYSGSPLENERIPSSSSAIPYMEQALQLSSDSEGETTPTVPSKSLVPTHKKKGILKNSSHLNSHGSEVESGHSRQSSMEEDEAVYLLEEDCVANETQVNVEIEISNNSNSRHDSGFVDSPDNRNNSCNGSTSEDQGSAETETGSTPKQDVVFDSTKKPKRGILKNKHRYTGSDSGCVMDCSVTVLDGRPDSPEKNDAVFDNSYDLTDIESVLDGIEADLKSVVGQSKAITCDKIHKDVSVGKYQSQDGFQENTELSRAKDQPVLTRRRGILKRHGKFSSSDETKRYSLGSQSSNSSADVLDFSYDSAEESYIGNAKPNPETTDHAYAKNTCTEAFEGQVVNGKTYDVISKFDDVIHKIDLLSDELCDAGSFHDDGSIFDLAEAEDVYKKALEICDKLK